MSRAGRIALGMVGVAVALLIVGGAGFQWVNNQPWFCNSCHEMNFHYHSWQTSTHGALARCLDCHTEPGVRGFIEEKVRGAEQLAAHVTGNYAVPIKIIVRVKNDQCLACHPEAPALPDQTIQVRHDVHVDKKVLCADCHSRLVHAQPDQARVMQRDQCDSCHQAHPASLMTGVHATLNCSQCHVDGKYQNQDPRCETCHTLPPGHLEGITTGCDECHTPAGWKPANFDHSKFPLIGSHQSLACEQCHPGGRFQGTSPACEACHQLPPNHLAGITTGCAQCHSPTGWKPANFDHSQFPLTGVHQSLTCDKCHTGGVFQGLSAACSNCHTPPSTHVGMPDDCAQCHTPEGFSPSTFNHQPVGEHIPAGEVSLQCTNCHAAGYAEYTCMGSGCHSSNNPQGE